MSSDEDEELNDLAFLRRELDALREALSKSYRQAGSGRREGDGAAGGPLGTLSAEGAEPTEEGGGDKEDDDVELDWGEAGAGEQQQEQELQEPEQQEQQRRQWRGWHGRQEQRERQLQERLELEAAAGEEEEEESEEEGGTVAAVRAALKANRALQERLQRLLHSTNVAINKNANMVERVKSLELKKTAAQTAGVGMSSLQSAMVSNSWFWQADGVPPPPHPDAKDLAPVFQALPLAFRRAPWTEGERRRLREAVLQMVQEIKLDAALGELQARVEGGGEVTMEDYQQRSEEVGALTLDSPDVLAIADALSEEQWGVVAQRAQLAQRTPQDVELQWRNAARPSLLQGAFSAREDDELRELVAVLGDREWVAVSQRLGGGGVRTPLACLGRYQQLLQQGQAPSEYVGEKGELNEAGIQRLTELVAKHGSHWKLISQAFGCRWNGEQLMHLWRRHKQRTEGGAGLDASATPVAPRKGKWTPEEDELLLKAMAVHQRKWSIVAKLVPGRSDVQCRERFMNNLDPELKITQEWSQEEDALLRLLVPQLTHKATGKVKWGPVAMQIPGRTDRQCANRWSQVLSGDESRAQRRRGRSPKAAKARAAAAAGEGGAGGGQEKEGAAAAAPPKRKRFPPPKAAKSVAAAAGEEGAAAAAAAAVAAAAAAAQQEEVEEEGEGSGAAAQPRKRRRRAAGRGAKQRAEGGPSSNSSSSSEGEKEAEGSTTEQEETEDEEWGEEYAPSSKRQQQGGAQPAQRAKRTSRSALNPPAATCSAMPGTREGVVGWTVEVWWILDEETGRGKLYEGSITAYDQQTGEHTVEYVDGPQVHTLADDTVVWGEDGEGREVITGPGAVWPTSGQGSQPAAAAAAGAATQQPGEAAAGGPAAAAGLATAV